MLLPLLNFKIGVTELIGLFQFSSKVIRLGRPFICRLYTMQDSGSHPDHFICQPG